MTKAELKSLVSGIAISLGVDPLTLRVFARIESNWSAKARNEQTGAAGLFQFLKSTAAEHGIDPLDPAEATAATCLRIRRDAKVLEAREIEPTTAHLYLCHQQGRTGFLQLYRCAYDDEPIALPAARGRTMAANLPAKDKAAWSKLPNDQEKARYFLEFWKGRIAKFTAEEA